MRAGQQTYYAVVVKASLKSLIWCDPKVFRADHYGPPQTWTELTALSRRAADAGTSPWCLGLESTSDSGWPGTDWIEDILLHQSGPEIYQSWYKGTLPWTSPQVKQAWQRWGEIVGSSRMMDGGARSALITNYGNAGGGMFRKNPGCLMDHEASFIMANYSTTLAQNGKVAQSGADFNLVPFPWIDDRYANALEVGADLAGMFRNTPQARALIQFLASKDAQQIWPGVPGSGALSANTDVPLSVYGNLLFTNPAKIITGKAAASLSSGSAPLSLSFDASDEMPAAVRTAFYQAVLQYVADPRQLDGILSRLDSIRTRTRG
jgi:alpha-glucoside transport system substrate-binding protein